MAEAATTLDLKDVLTTEDLSTDRLHEVRREVHCHVDLRSQLEELLADFGTKVAKSLSSENKAEVRKGTAHWLLGQSEEAITILQGARASKEKSYVLGVSYLEAGRPHDALVALKEASDADSSDPHISAAYCEAKIRAGDYDLAIAGWTNDMNDPTQIVNYEMRGGEGSGSFAYWTRYNNPALNDKITAADLEQDPAKREALYIDIQRTFLADAPLVFIANLGATAAWGPNVEGFLIDGLSYYRFEDVILTQ